MGNIVLLDELTINKIAAGEVIERPASVVKEMVENSIDAGATNITVEIKNGGITYIKVTDNGKGIAQDDLEMAFERHATSKIRVADDLNIVTSMGFRGEALASIAAISNVEMISKTKEQEIGYKIVVEGGDVLEQQEAACPIGTSITVKNLFYNTPVRYKFLKKDYTESGYIEDVITRIALVNPNIAIKLINSGKTVIQTNGNCDLKSVIYSIYGKDVANGVTEVSYKYEDIEINGVIGKPEIARSNRSNQLFFVNKRYIKDKTLTAATEQAYKGLIPIGKFGFVILNIQMNPAKVDVNVHPAKLEVRFEDENKIFQSIYHAIKDTLLKNDLVSESLPYKIDRKMTFEEKLNQSEGLFGFRKQNEQQIERYTEEESKIKTNKIENKTQPPIAEQPTVKPSIAEQPITESTIVEPSIGEPINTEDILKKLREIKGKIESELKEKNIGVKEESTEYELELKDETSQNEKQFLDDNPQVISSDFNEMYTKLFGTLPTDNETEKETNIQQNTEINAEIDNVKNDEINSTEIDNTSIDNIEIDNTVLDNTTIDNIETDNTVLDNTTIDDVEIKETDNTKKQEIDIKKDNISVFENIEEFEMPTYKFIGIVFNTYIILEINQEMYILDQHAAHERIMYERVKQNYYSDRNKDSQMLLLPDIVTLTHKDMELALENLEMFEQAGFILEEFGENTIKINGVPTICFDLDTKELFLETLDEINTISRTSKQEKEERFIATVACKAAVKANMALDEREVTALMDELLKLPNPFTCPHGRPTVIKMSKYEIERKFARK